MEVMVIVNKKEEQTMTPDGRITMRGALTVTFLIRKNRAKRHGVVKGVDEKIYNLLTEGNKKPVVTQ
jgi:hypothetical protein